MKIKKIFFCGILSIFLFGFSLQFVAADNLISDACIKDFANKSWDAFAVSYKAKNPNAFVCDSNRELFTENAFPICEYDCRAMGYVGGVCESGTCHDGRVMLVADGNPANSNCNIISEMYTGGAAPCCCVNVRRDPYLTSTVTKITGTDLWWITDPGKKPTFPGGYQTPATTACLAVSGVSQVCIPNSVSGCKVCASDGSAWVDTNSKCPSGQICSNGSCVSNCTPKTCSSLSYQCGSVSDGCGGTLSCGSCASGYVCLSGKCVTAQVCIPNSVSGCKVCASDGSAWVDTNSKCPSGQLCFNGTCAVECPDNMAFGCRVYKNGVLTDDNTKCPNNGVCLKGICVSSSNAVCVPKTCTSLGLSCGSVSDGCGGTLSCGSCASGYVCANGACGQKMTRDQIINAINLIREKIASLLKQLADLTAKNRL